MAGASDLFENVILGAMREIEANAGTIGYPPEHLRHEYAGRILQIVANGYLMVFRSRSEAPAFVPFVGDMFNWGAPNGDTVMGHATVDPRGLYRIIGHRGSAEIANIMVQAGAPTLGSIGAEVISEVDLNDLPRDASGRFEVLLSAERPPDHSGPWMSLGNAGATVVTRSIVVAPDQIDASFAIKRIDRAAPDQIQTPSQFWEHTANMMTWVRTLTGFIMTSMARKMASPNENLVYAFQAYGNQTQQHYCEGAFSIDTDKALILEATLPRSVRYWSVQVLDALFGAIDFVSHQSTLNGHQASIDEDGVARVVISLRDPGVANWLDPAGATEGAIMWRWNRVDHQPPVVATLVDFDDIAAHLPPGTKHVSAAARAQSISARSISHQLRRHL